METLSSRWLVVVFFFQQIFFNSIITGSKISFPLLMITSQFHSFLTDLDVPLRTLPEPIQLSPKTVGTFST